MTYHDPSWPKPASHYLWRYVNGARESTSCWCAATSDHHIGEEVEHERPIEGVVQERNGMRVRDLIEQLLTFDPDSPVAVQSDGIYLDLDVLQTVVNEYDLYSWKLIAGESTRVGDPVVVIQ